MIVYVLLPLVRWKITRTLEKKTPTHFLGEMVLFEMAKLSLSLSLDVYDRYEWIYDCIIWHLSCTCVSYFCTVSELIILGKIWLHFCMESPKTVYFWSVWFWNVKANWWQRCYCKKLPNDEMLNDEEPVLKINITKKKNCFM